MVKAADAFNKPAETGYEYLLTRVRFVYGSGGKLLYHLYQEYFKAFSSENKEYTTPSVINLQPAFIGEALYPGATVEGWIPFTISQNDSRPVMFYANSESWFQLY